MILDARARFGALFAIVCALGCTPSPESTCAKIVELADKELAAGKMLDAKKTKVKDKCLTDMKKLDDEDPEAYQCTAKCIRAVKELNAAFTCVSVCGHKEKEKDKDDPK